MRLDAWIADQLLYAPLHNHFLIMTRRVSEENASNSSLMRRVTKQGHLLLAALATVLSAATVASVKTANPKYRCSVRPCKVSLARYICNRVAYAIRVLSI